MLKKMRIRKTGKKKNNLPAAVMELL